jgi:hypothetical protein
MPDTLWAAVIAVSSLRRARILRLNRLTGKNAYWIREIEALGRATGLPIRQDSISMVVNRSSGPRAATARLARQIRTKASDRLRSISGRK